LLSGSIKSFRIEFGVPIAFQVYPTYSTFNGGVNIGGTAAVDDNDLYVTDNCSALTFTDRTPHYSGDALAEIRGVRGNGKGRIDHASLPAFARKAIHVKRNGEDVSEEGRDLGAMVSILTTAVQQLLERVEAIEGA